MSDVQITDTYLEPCQTPMMNLVCENSSWVLQVHYFYKQMSSYMIDGVLKCTSENSLFLYY